MRENIVIYDDNKSDAERTESILVQFKESINNNENWEINIYNDVINFMKDIKIGNVEPDIVFMSSDMKLEVCNGIAKQIGVIAPGCHIVYLSRYPQYVSEIHFTEYSYFVLKNELEKRLPEIYINMLNKKYQKVLQIELRKNKFVAINQDDIIYLERKGRRTFICGRTENWETYLSLNELENMIQDEGIIRCHNSFMVAMKEIKSYVREVCIMSNGENIPISRKYQPIFKQKFLQWSKGSFFK